MDALERILEEKGLKFLVYSEYGFGPKCIGFLVRSENVLTSVAQVILELAIGGEYDLAKVMSEDIKVEEMADDKAIVYFPNIMDRKEGRS